MTTEIISTIAGLLRTAFPDPKVQITTLAVEGVLRALRSVASDAPEMFAGHGIDLDGDGVPDLSWPRDILGATDKRIVDYWLGNAVHSRVAPIKSSFAATLPMVRVLVDDSWEAEAIATAIGTVFAGDHKLYSRTVAEEYLSEVSAALDVVLPKLERVECVTPARVAGARFGAISVYIFSGEHGPFAYSLEAGMATGEARVLYFSPNLKQGILRRSGYTPTPFSTFEQYYYGLFAINPTTHEPEQLDVEVRSAMQAEMHMQIIVEYTKVTDPQCVYPAVLTLQAACRVAAIAEASGMPFKDVGPLLPLFAALGRDQYAWRQKPEKKS